MKSHIEVFQSQLNGKWYLREVPGAFATMIFPDLSWNTKEEAERFAKLF